MPDRNFGHCRRVVIKIGTSMLAASRDIDRDYIEEIARQIVLSRKGGAQILLVSSGAIGLGAHALGLTKPPTLIRRRQACAAIGQPILMRRYHKAFGALGMRVAQVLLTNAVLNSRSCYLNLRETIQELLALDILVICNENDSVSIDEIGLAFGDNDRLGALIASKIDADLLIILSDVDALYDADPRRDPTAKPLSIVSKIDSKLITAAGKSTNTFAKGGMRSKLDAVRIAGAAGCDVLIAHGREPNVIPRLLAGEAIGTWFPARTNLGGRKRWILHSTPRGKLRIDDGAFNALQRSKSLLPTGLIGVIGNFDAGEVVAVYLQNDEIAKAHLLTRASSEELRRIIGQNSQQIMDSLGMKNKNIIARPDDIVFIEAIE